MKKPEHRIGEYAALHTWTTKQLLETTTWLAQLVVEGRDGVLAKLNGMTPMERLQMYQQELARREDREAKERVADGDGTAAADIEKEAWLKATGRVDYYR